ncbi:hypothetical protein LPJ73_001840 [Coemansia sp. RSA 2703]|nr:hypothetical protein LPJ73_001840 [Coemansia sp. RSA 2703]KAJ2371241.1 hypothetical protein IW150_004687 [Coemansia sp. RSA 2607]KAJ2395445.1 hypothetical protein GGI05_001577 [Coemansia sp. RSA 2603]
MYTEVIMTDGQLKKIAKNDRAIVFHAEINADLGYRGIRQAIEPLIGICVVEGRLYFHILDLTKPQLLKDYSDYKKQPLVKRGVAFYKKGELLLEMDGFSEKKFREALVQFDKMQPGQFGNSGCCGCTIM